MYFKEIKMKQIYLLGALSILSVQSVYANTVPIVYAGADQTVYLGSSTALHGTATDPDGDAILGWNWSVYDAPVGSTPLVGAEFSADASFGADQEGDYILSLIAYDGTGWSLPDTVTITYVLNQLPTAIGTASQTSGVAPLSVQFDATQSFDPEGGDLIYAWEFGDGTAPTLDPTPLHIYQSPGTYFAQLAVEDDFGQIDFSTIEINVSAVPVPAAVWLFGSGLIGLIGIARRKKS
jgi:PKD repeat protein